MKGSHRKVLQELMDICAYLGNQLDYTATHDSKLKDRQQAHKYVYRILYSLLTDSPKNEYRHEDWENLEAALKALRELKHKNYPDRNGYK